MSNRSGSQYSTPRDANRVPFLVAASTADGITPVVLEADPTTHALVTSSSGGGGGGTQYTDGASTIAHPIGTIPVYDKAGTITAVSVANPLPVSATVSTAGLATDTNQTSGSQQTKITDGTNVANTLKSDGTAAGQNSQLVAGTYLSVPFTTTTVQAVGTTDAGNYNYVVIQHSSVGGSATSSFQVSNDNSTWFSIVLTNTAASSSASSTGSTSSIWSGALTARYFRLNVTGIVSGTTAGTILFKTAQAPNSVAISSISATGSAVPANAFFQAGQNAAGTLAALRMSDLADASVGGTLLATGGYVYNGTTYDKQRSGPTTGSVLVSPPTATGSAVPANAFYIGMLNASGQLAGLNAINNITDSNAGGNWLAVGNGIWNSTGTVVEKTRTANAASNTTGTGLLGVGNMIFDGTNWQKQTSTTAMGTVGTTSAVVNVGQQTSNTSAVQLSASSTVPTNGIVIEALIANAAVVYIGGSGVTTSTGFQLSPGQSLTLTCNLNTIYVIGSNATDKVCWSVA